MVTSFCSSVLLSGCVHAPNATSLGACAALLASANLWPSRSDLRRAKETIERYSVLIIGDSTLYDKYMYLRAFARCIARLDCARTSLSL